MLMDLLRATHERAQRSPLAQFDDLPLNQVQLLHDNRVSISCDLIFVVPNWNRMQFLFLPQIRRAGCDEIITTFARPEFGFTMKQNFLSRLLGWWVCSQQPMNGQNGRRWRSVTAGRRFKVSLFIFTSPVLPQIRHWPVRKSHSFQVAIFFGTLMANPGTHHGQRPEQSAFRQISPRRKKSASGEVFLWGHRADRKPAVKTLTNEASIEGRFRFAGKKPDL